MRESVEQRPRSSTMPTAGYQLVDVDRGDECIADRDDGRGRRRSPAAWQAVRCGRGRAAMPTPVSGSPIGRRRCGCDRRRSRRRAGSASSCRRSPSRSPCGVGSTIVQHAVGDADVQRIAGVDGAIDRLRVGDAQQRAAFGQPENLVDRRGHCRYAAVRRAPMPGPARAGDDTQQLAVRQRLHAGRDPVPTSSRLMYVVARLAARRTQTARASRRR